MYLISGVEHPPPDDVHVITCIGCLLLRKDQEDWLMSDSVDFRTKEEILIHLEWHRIAGHVVPLDAIVRIKEDDWLC